MLTAKKARSRLSYEKKKSIVGYVFLIPWAIGAVFFLLLPTFESILYSIGNLRIGEDYGVDIIGFTHYIKAFTEDSSFLPLLGSTLPPMLPQTIIVVLLSLFLAILLNRKFFGRTVVRGIFFFPVIIANSIIISIINGDVFANNLMNNAGASQMFSSEMLGVLISEMQGGQKILEFVTSFVDSVFGLLWKSGIQTILFLTALQAIPTSMYEAAEMEGGTTWEIFWKITFPMVSPTILINIVYTIIDTFGDYGNSVMKYINDYTVRGDLNYSSALIWVYTLIMLLIIGVCYIVIDRFVYYEV